MSKTLGVLLLALMGALCGSRDASVAAVSQATAYPFNPNPFTVAICATDPCSPKLAPDSAAIIAHMMPCAGCMNMGMVSIPVHVAPPSYAGDSTFPIYHAKPTDSNYAIACSRSYIGHVCSSWNPSTINVPDGASGSCTHDHHAILIEPDGREYEFGHFNNGQTWNGDCTPISGGGTLYVGHDGVCTITAFANGGVCKGSGVASGVPVIDTLLNPQELLNGDVTHELSGAGNCPSNTWQWPAHQSDGKCPGVGIPEGAIVWLDLSFAQINSLPGHYNWDRTILRYQIGRASCRERV